MVHVPLVPQVHVPTTNFKDKVPTPTLYSSMAKHVPRSSSVVDFTDYCVQSAITKEKIQQNTAEKERNSQT